MMILNLSLRRMSFCGICVLDGTRRRPQLAPMPVGIALFLLQWCALTGRDWRTAAGYLGMFMLRLRHAETAEEVGRRLGPAGPGHSEVSQSQKPLHWEGCGRVQSIVGFTPT
jgi:hypothetical protein